MKEPVVIDQELLTEARESVDQVENKLSVIKYFLSSYAAKEDSFKKILLGSNNKLF